MTTRLAQAAFIIAIALGLQACGGEDVVMVQQPTQISKGWELKDLQKALEAGAITKPEYEKVRQKILNRPN